MKWVLGQRRRQCICVLLLLGTLTVGGALAGDGRAQSEGFAYTADLKGEIDATARRELDLVLEDAKRKHARLVILRLDTPGGEAETARAMSSALLAEPLPVVVYVAPDGSRAGSAGVFLTLAGDVAAMAPQTNIGSASPLLVGPQGVVEAPRVLYRKVVNDYAAYVRTLAEGHGRNADLAERMVRQGTNVTATRARRERLVDLVAGSEAALLKRLDGFRVKGRKAQVLRTAGLRILRSDLPDEDPDSPGDGTLVLGLGLPGLIAIGMVATMVAILIRQLARS